MMKEFEDNHLKEQDNNLARGKRPHEVRPFTRTDKIRVILKIRLGFDERESHVLDTFLSSNENREYTMRRYNISKSNLYRILGKVEEVFEPEDPA